MKKLTCLVLFLVAQLVQAQEHFAGISTSKRVGIINLEVNPSELANLKITSKFSCYLLA